jgi:uncharacterized protein (DUF885 family)
MVQSALLSKRVYGLVGLVLLALGGTPHPVAPRDAHVERRVMAIADLVVDDALEGNPEFAALLRVPEMSYDTLPDDSVQGVQARAERQAAWLTELRGIDQARLMGSPAALSYALARASLEDAAAVRRCRFELWTVSQMLNGWQVRFTILAQAQPVGTEELRRQALQRFRAVPAYIDTQIANLRAGLRLGYSAAQVNVRHVIEQLDALLALAPEHAPFFSPAARDGTLAFRERFTALVREQLTPAVQRYRDFLRDEYLPRARTAPGVAANPDGTACYRATVRAATTLDLDPDHVHTRGLAQLTVLESEMKKLAATHFDGMAVPELLRRFKTDPQYLYGNKAEILTQAQAAIDRAQAALPRVFGLLPTAKAVLEPVPAFQERTAAPYYLMAALDGSRAATYRVRLYQAEQQSTVTGESITFHEVIPGHHLQISISNERTGLPRIARFLFNSGFSEGWGLYAERLADELGLYSRAADRFGMLSNFAWRAARMVVDTGLHVRGWERQRAIDTLLAHTALSPDQAAAEIDRYIALPGQATAYLVGYLEIRALREEAERALGSRFELRAFHDRVLENGSVPLPLLRRYIEAWMAAEKGQ